MVKKELLVKVQNVFRDVFDDDGIVLSLDTAAEDIEAWTSLAHIQLIASLERAFNFKFSSGEIFSWRTINDLLDIIQNRSN